MARGRVALWLLGGGFVGPILFVAVVLVSGWTLPGYDPTTPLGPPSDPSLMARAHDVAAGIAMVCVIGAMIDLGWRFAAESGGARWALYSRLSAVGTTVFLLASFIQTDVLGLLERIAIVLATGWVAQVMWHFRREVAVSA